MTTPETETNHFTRLPNSILDALLHARLSPAARQILDVIIRFTYGFNRTSHAMSITFFAKATRRHIKIISRALKELRERQIIKQHSAATFRMPTAWGIRPAREWKTEGAKTGGGDKNVPSLVRRQREPSVHKTGDKNVPQDIKEQKKEKKRDVCGMRQKMAQPTHDQKPKTCERKIKAGSADPLPLFALFETQFGKLNVDPEFAREIVTVMVGCKMQSLTNEFQKLAGKVGNQNIPAHLANPQDLFRALIASAAHRALGGDGYGG